MSTTRKSGKPEAREAREMQQNGAVTTSTSEVMQTDRTLASFLGSLGSPVWDRISDAMEQEQREAEVEDGSAGQQSGGKSGAKRRVSAR